MIYDIIVSPPPFPAPCYWTVARRCWLSVSGLGGRSRRSGGSIWTPPPPRGGGCCSELHPLPLPRPRHTPSLPLSPKASQPGARGAPRLAEDLSTGMPTVSHGGRGWDADSAGVLRRGRLTSGPLGARAGQGPREVRASRNLGLREILSLGVLIFGELLV